MRAITAATGRVRAEGKVIHAGRQTATAEGRLVDAGGRLYAHATTTCILFAIPDAAATQAAATPGAATPGAT